MKKISIILVMLIILMAGIFAVVPVNAADAVNVSLSSSNQTRRQGDTFTITVGFSKKLKGAQFTLDYDTSKFDFVSCSHSTYYKASTKKFAYDNMVNNLSSVTFTFKVKDNSAEGKGSVSLNTRKVIVESAAGDPFNGGTKSVAISVQAKVQNPTSPSDPTPNPVPTPNPEPIQKPESPKPTTPTQKPTTSDNTKPKDEPKKDTPVVEQPDNSKEDNENNVDNENQVDNQTPVDDGNNVAEGNTTDGENNTYNNIDEPQENNVTEEKKEFNIWKYVKYILIFIVIIGVIIIIIRANKETY